MLCCVPVDLFGSMVILETGGEIYFGLEQIFCFFNLLFIWADRHEGLSAYLRRL